jgi:hypothetical protein
MKIAGVQVQDAKAPLTVEVTREDIKGASTKKPEACAVARAIVRETGAEAARVHLSRTYVKRNGSWRRYYTPNDVRSEVVAFDRGGKFEPGAYALMPMPPSARLAAKAAYRKRGPQRTKRTPRATPNVRDSMKADWE